MPTRAQWRNQHCPTATLKSGCDPAGAVARAATPRWIQGDQDDNTQLPALMAGTKSQRHSPGASCWVVPDIGRHSAVDAGARRR
jgi:hypothetical protein